LKFIVNQFLIGLSSMLSIVFLYNVFPLISLVFNDISINGLLFKSIFSAILFVIVNYLCNLLRFLLPSDIIGFLWIPEIHAVLSDNFFYKLFGVYNLLYYSVI